MKRFLVLLLVLSFFGCYPRPKEVAPPPIPEYRVDRETETKIRGYLTEVEEICRNTMDLESVGRSTTTQTARLLDLGKTVSPMLINVIRDKGKDWKYRYWACDLLGYIEDENNILHLVAVVEDESEEQKIRFCALRSLDELGNPEAIDYLVIAEQIVEDESLREEIKKVIEKLKIKARAR